MDSTSSHPVICALDLAGKVGVATGPVGSRPDLRTWNLAEAGDARPQRLVMLDQLISDHIAIYQVSRVFYEAPLPISVLMHIGATEQTIQMMRSLCATVEQTCGRLGVPVDTWTVQEARHAVIGQGRFKRGEAKREVMAFCRMIGYRPEDDNQADALIGHLYESALLNPRIAHLSSPLFSRQG